MFYVTAHEVAHQWWAHQVIGANVQGATVMSESLAQYSALMVMEKEYGRAKMRRFLKHELDSYLSGRGGETVEELPLYRVENQPYIHYRKGSLVFYRLREEIGEAALNRALKKFLHDKGYQQPPYTTSVELLDYIRAEARPEQQCADRRPVREDQLLRQPRRGGGREEARRRQVRGHARPACRQACTPTARARRPPAGSTTGSRSACSRAARRRGSRREGAVPEAPPHHRRQIRR